MGHRTPLMNKATLAAVVPVIGLLAVTGCAQVDGGAVEIRWDIRDANGGRIGCDGDVDDKGARQVLKLDRLYFRLEVTQTTGEQKDLCQGDDRCQFECTASTTEIMVGTTPFFIPPGDFLIGSHAEGVATGASDLKTLGPAQDVVAPRPVLRQVMQGQVTDLNVNLIIVGR